MNLMKGLILISLLSLGASSLFAAGQFKLAADIFSGVGGQIDSSNTVVNAGGTGQFYLNSGLSILNANIFPTYTDKGIMSTVKIRISPFEFGNDYLKIDGFNFMSTTESLDVNLFDNRYAYRPSDPMFTGMSYWNPKYVNAAYNMPLLFSGTKNIYNPAYYSYKTKEDRFMKLGQDLIGVNLVYKGDFNLGISAFVTPAYSNSVIIGDLGANLELDEDISLEMGLIAKLENHLSDDRSAVSSRNFDDKIIFNGLLTRYADTFSSLQAGAYLRGDLFEFIYPFAEGTYRMGSGVPGMATNSNSLSQIDVFAGADISIAENNELELSFLYKMAAANSRMEIAVKNATAMELVEGVNLNLNASFVYMNDSTLNLSVSNGMMGNLSMSLPFDLFDMGFAYRLAGTYENINISSNSNSYVSAKTELDFLGFDKFELYAGAAVYMSIADSTFKESFWDNNQMYLVPLAGVNYLPNETLSIRLNLNYSVNVFGYDYDGKTFESAITPTVTRELVSGTRYRIVKDWFTLVAMPVVNLAIDLKF